MPDDELTQTQTLFKSVIQDRRRYPRVTLRRPGQAFRQGKTPVGVSVQDISPDGLQIRCGRRKALALHPAGRAIRDGEEGPELQVVFAVDIDSVRIPVTVLGRIVFFALINSDLVALGLRYTNISAASRRTLKTFIEQSLAPEELA